MRIYCICFRNVPTVEKSLVIDLENCGLNMQYINAHNIILGITNPLDPSMNGGLRYLKQCIKIEKTTTDVLASTKKEEYICKK